MTVREIGPDGFTGKRLEVTPEQIKQWKEKWAERGAKELRKACFEIEANRAVGHLDLDRQRQAALERGDLARAETLNHEATKHRGPAASAMERKGQETDRGKIDREKFTAAQETKKLRQSYADRARNTPRGDGMGRPAAKAAIEKEKIERRFVEPQPQSQPEHGGQRAKFLRGSAIDISFAYRTTDSPKAFVASLAERGIVLAVPTKQEAEESRKQAEAARAEGRSPEADGFGKRDRCR